MENFPSLCFLPLPLIATLSPKLGPEASPLPGRHCSGCESQVPALRPRKTPNHPAPSFHPDAARPPPAGLVVPTELSEDPPGPSSPPGKAGEAGLTLPSPHPRLAAPAAPLPPSLTGPRLGLSGPSGRSRLPCAAGSGLAAPDARSVRARAPRPPAPPPPAAATSVPPAAHGTRTPARPGRK